MLILITGQYILSSSDEFASFGAVFHNNNYQWFTNKIALSSKYALSATFKLNSTTGWCLLSILNVFKWFSSQVLHKNTLINLFSSSFQVSRFKDNVLNTELLTLFKLTLCSVVVLFWYFTHLFLIYMYYVLLHRGRCFF